MQFQQQNTQEFNFDLSHLFRLKTTVFEPATYDADFHIVTLSDLTRTMDSYSQIEGRKKYNRKKLTIMNAIFDKVDFRKINFSEIQFLNCNFHQCTFSNCSFIETYFQKCNFYACGLKKCDFDKTIFDATEISKCGFDTCEMDSILKLPARFKEVRLSLPDKDKVYLYSDNDLIIDGQTVFKSHYQEELDSIIAELNNPPLFGQKFIVLK